MNPFLASRHQLIAGPNKQTGASPHPPSQEPRT